MIPIPVKLLLTPSHTVESGLALLIASASLIANQILVTVLASSAKFHYHAFATAKIVNPRLSRPALLTFSCHTHLRSLRV